MYTETLLDKNQVINSFSDLPDQVSSEELIERILFIESVYKGLQDIDKGKTVPHEQVMRELREIKAKKMAALSAQKA